jgi:hypothetical protein
MSKRTTGSISHAKKAKSETKSQAKKKINLKIFFHRTIFFEIWHLLDNWRDDSPAAVPQKYINLNGRILKKKHSKYCFWKIVLFCSYFRKQNCANVESCARMGAF